jgi:alanyl-tRNA synthetase
VLLVLPLQTDSFLPIPVLVMLSEEFYAVQSGTIIPTLTINNHCYSSFYRYWQNSSNLSFPELQQQLDFISKVVKEEEEGFLRTLDKGLKRIDETIAMSQATKVIEGAIAFELYDTYGFPY